VGGIHVSENPKSGRKQRRTWGIEKKRKGENFKKKRKGKREVSSAWFQRQAKGDNPVCMEGGGRERAWK